MITNGSSENKLVDRSSSLFESLFRKHDAIMLLLNAETGEIIDANDAALRFYGYTMQQITSMKIGQINQLPPDILDVEQQKAISGEQTLFTRSHRLANGEIRTVEVHTTLILIKETKRLFSVIHDITERKKAEEAHRESDSHFKSFVESSTAGYFFIDTDGIIRDVNSAWVRMYKYDSKEEIIGRHFSAIQKLDDRKKADEFVKGIMAGDERYLTGEFSRKCKDNSTGWHNFSARPFIQSGKIIGIEGVIFDITERKLMENSLRLQAEILVNVAEGVQLTRVSDGVIVFTTPRFEDMFGYQNGELFGKNVSILNAPDDKSPEAVASEIQNALKQNGVWQGNVHNIRKDNSTFWCKASVSSFDHAEYGKVWISTHEDVTERKKIEDAIRESERKYHSLFESMSEGVALHEMIYAEDGKAVDYRILDVNPMFEKHTGILLKDAQGRLATEVYKTQPAPYMEVYERVARTGEPHSFETYFPPLEKAFSISAYSPRPGRFATVFTDITKRKQAEEAIRRQAALLEAQVNSTLDGIVIADVNGTKILQNRRMVELWKIPRHVADNPDNKQQIQHAMHMTKDPEKFAEKVTYLCNHPNEITHDEVELTDGTTLDGYSAPVLGEDGQNYGRIWMFRDITAQKLAEEEHLKYEQQLQLNSKLESLGILAGGIAHDFNNLMGGIFGYIDIASEETKDKKVTAYLSKAMNTIDRARALTQQLLTFAKGGAPVRKVGSLFPFVQETAQFALSGADVSCKFDVSRDLWTCNFDKNQIGQVVDNIIINAQQAMPVGGTIELAARNTTLEEKEHPLLKKGNYVKISIKDTGIGIPKELLSRIFDPFFTTKPKGHGLGLATCYSIIKRHSGVIDVDSEPGKGSTFHVYLPASMGEVSSDTKKSTNKYKGTGTFLVMDDEEVMREAISDMLGSFGYTVVCKENGREAVDYFTGEIEDKRKVAGMIFDLTVPGGMGGQAAVAEIRKLNTEIPVFVASGYADDPVMKNPAEYGFTASICKPFRKTELMEMLGKYLQPNK